MHLTQREPVNKPVRHDNAEATCCYKRQTSVEDTLPCCWLAMVVRERRMRDEPGMYALRTFSKIISK